MNRRPTHRKGFSLLEVLAASALVAIGVTASLAAARSVVVAESYQEKSETLQRLALQKYKEVESTVDLNSGALSGDFTDWNLQNLTWQATAQATNTTNLDSLSVTVTDSTTSKSATVSGLVFLAPAQGAASSAAGAPALPGAGGGGRGG